MLFVIEKYFWICVRFDMSFWNFDRLWICLCFIVMCMNVVMLKLSVLG